MKDAVEKNEQAQKSLLWDVVCFTLAFILCAQIMRDIVPPPLLWTLAAFVASCTSYLAFPVFNAGFIKYVVLIQVCLTPVIIFMWLVPPLLEKFMPPFWAYFVPMLLLANAVYFVPHLDAGKRGALWKWFLGSAVFAAIFGWFLSSS